MSSIFDTSTLIALGLIGIVVVIFLIDRMGVLPRKSLPYIAAALAGAFGIALFRGYRSDQAKERIKKQEEELAKREQNLKVLKDTYNASDQVLQKMQADLEAQRAAARNDLLQIQAGNKAEKDRIDKLSGDELHDETRKVLSSL